eukprot:750448-Hanusia_phi.AAC.2
MGGVVWRLCLSEGGLFSLVFGGRKSAMAGRGGWGGGEECIARGGHELWFAMPSAQEIRSRLESYSRAKVSSFLEGAIEELLIKQPIDPIEFLVRYLIQNRQDLRDLVANETLKVAQENGTHALPPDDHPLINKIDELKQTLKEENRIRRKEAKAAASKIQELEERVHQLVMFLSSTRGEEDRLRSMGFRIDTDLDDEMQEFFAWEETVAANSPYDRKNTPTFKFRQYTEFPPMTTRHLSILRSILKPTTFKEYRDERTSFGFTFSNYIQPAVTCPSLRVGVANGDKECYLVFQKISVDIIKSVHGLDPHVHRFRSELSPDSIEVPANFSEVAQVVKSTHLRAVRNLSELPFSAGVNRVERASVEQLLRNALLDFVQDGVYESISSMDPIDEEILLADDLLMQEPAKNSLQQVCGASRDWPENRGIFHNIDNSIVCWLNGEDHLKINVLDKHHDVPLTFRKFCELHEAIKQRMEAAGKHFACDELFGYLSTCPSNAGLGFTCQVVLELETGRKEAESLSQCVTSLNLSLKRQKQAAVKSDVELWVLEHKRAFGVTETDAVRNIIEAIYEIVQSVANLEELPSR